MQRLSCVYTANYCEENVYHLLKRLILEGKSPERLLCCFISNSNESVPLFCQRASQQPDGLVCWDYHVVVLEHHSPSVIVWDLDTTLPFPCSFVQYAQQGLKTHLQLLPAFQRCYRLIAADTYLQHFASDRSHMKKEDGSWMATPPAYPCIQAADGCVNNLNCYREMSDASLAAAVVQRDWLSLHDSAASDKFGIVIDEAQLLRCFEQHIGLQDDKQQDPSGEEGWTAAQTVAQAGA